MYKWIFILSFACGCFLNAEPQVLALSGSTREGSLNKKLLTAAIEMARELGAHVTVLDLKDHPLPFYDGDLESQETPANVQQLQTLMKQNQVIFIASPEYNRSVSGVLKNAIDWASRKSNETFKDKKFVLMCASPGYKGGAAGLDHLQTIIEHVGGIVVSGCITLPKAQEAFDAEGKLIDETVKNDLKSYVERALRN